jgi:hypothetical protein
MNAFNRIVMVLGILIWIAAVTYVVLLPLDAVGVARIGLDLFEQSLFDDQFFTYFLIVSGVILFVLLMLLWLELRRPRRRTVRIKTQGRGNAQLDIESVIQSLEYRVDELAGVRQVRTHVRSRGKDVDVALDLDTSPSVNIPVLTDQVVSLAQDIVEGQLGLKIHGPVRVNIKHEPYPRGTMPVTTPQERDSSARPALVEPVLPRATERPAPKPAEPVSKPVVVSSGPATEAGSQAAEKAETEGEKPDEDDDAPKKPAW